jgi:hypothetical protein
MADRRLVGKYVDRSGQLLFWAGLGSVVGYWSADRGMRWLPDFLGGIVILALCSLGAIVLGRVMTGKAIDPQSRRVSTRAAVAIGLMALASAARLGVYWAAAPSPLTELDKSALHTAFAEDTLHYGEIDRGMASAVERVEGILPADRSAVLSADGERELLDLWRTLFDHAFAQDAIRIFYEDWYRFDASRIERASHVRSFLLSYGAELSMYERTARFAQVVLAHPSAAKFLDTPHGDLPEGTFSRLRQDLHGARDQARIAAGAQYMKFLVEGLAVDPEELGVGALWNDVEAKLDAIAALGLVDRATLQVRADLQGLKRTVRHTWYPAQARAASFLGDVRLRRIGWYLITSEQREAIDAELAPGDILLGRKNWYVSNVGLPGFWPHAILYVGDPAKLQALDGDPAVAAWVAAAGGSGTYTQWLAARFPRAWAEYQAGHEGHPIRVIEAVSEGVVLHSFDHATGDTLGAVRPKLPPLAKAQAIAYAFAQIGKPYDFDFDFATDHAIVCSELVWRAYRHAEGKAGFEIPLVEIGGRQTLPANEIARFYAEAYGSDREAFDFVLFYDADERARVSRRSDEIAFRESWKRSRWDIVVEEKTL